jgi:hypothetical protein
MCFVKYFFCKPKQIKSDTMNTALVRSEQEPESKLRCKLCNLTHEVSILPCKHALCTGCVETQKLYIYGPCLVCEHLNWNNLIPTS